MNLDDSKLFNEQVSKIHSEYEELRNEFVILLRDKNKTKPRIRGAISSAGVATEHLLDYIIRKEGRIDQLNALKPNQRGLYELKRIVEDVIPEKQKIHIGTIIPWRNLANHHSKSENVNDDELKAVETALNSLVKWFFEGYLKGEFADFSKNQYSNNSENSTDPARTAIRENFEKNPLNVPDYSILSKSKRAPKKKNKLPWIIGVLTGLATGYFGYTYLYGDNEVAHVTTKTHMSKDEVFDYIKAYFNTSNDKDADAHKYFINNVDTFYLKHNVNPTQINIIRQTSDYIDTKNSIDKISLYQTSQNDSVAYWRFWTDFDCYRPTRHEYQSGKVQLEFGINTDKKITRIKQVAVLRQHYSRKRPH
jgi:hypothetical protein